MKRIALALRAS